MPLEGKQLFVARAQNKEERQQNRERETYKFKSSKQKCNLYVTNFPLSTTESQFEKVFQHFGEIESIKLANAPKKGPYAFVCFKNPSSATSAKQALNGVSIFVPNQRLFINYYKVAEETVI